MDSEKLAELAADACDDRKATDVRLIRVDEVSSLADWLVIAGGLIQFLQDFRFLSIFESKVF